MNKRPEPQDKRLVTLAGNLGLVLEETMEAAAPGPEHRTERWRLRNAVEMLWTWDRDRRLTLQFGTPMATRARDEVEAVMRVGMPKTDLDYRLAVEKLLALVGKEETERIVLALVNRAPS